VVDVCEALKRHACAGTAAGAVDDLCCCMRQASDPRCTFAVVMMEVSARCMCAHVSSSSPRAWLLEELPLVPFISNCL